MKNLHDMQELHRKFLLDFSVQVSGEKWKCTLFHIWQFWYSSCREDSMEGGVNNMSCQFRQAFFGQYERISVISTKRKVIILLIIFINVAMIPVYIFSGEYRQLLWLFYYSIISNSPINWTVPLMPQEPALLLYGDIYPPLLVGLIAGVASFFVEIFNYQVLVPVCKLGQLEQFRKKRFYQVCERNFNRVPFAIIAFAGFTPVPHLPFRILSVTTGYSSLRYAFASFAGRMPFYYLVAATGAIFKLPNWVYIALFLVMVFMALGGKFIHSFRKEHNSGTI